MKKLFSLITALVLSLTVARADEGMWLPYSLNGQNLAEMQAMGCKLTAEQLFSFNQPSIKDAIVQFGGGCTGEIISPEGLLLTNHHCGLSYVQKHSSIEHDYLTDGFWAKSKGEELPNAGLSVLFLNKVEDVTEAVLKGVTAQTSEAERAELIAKNSKELTKERKGDRNVRVEIVPFYCGNQYILFEYDEYKDVRLVCCPPWGIGKFGADTDNWTWPRHKGDSRWREARRLCHDSRLSWLDRPLLDFLHREECHPRRRPRHHRLPYHQARELSQAHGRRPRGVHHVRLQAGQRVELLEILHRSGEGKAEYGDIFTGIKAKWDILDEIEKSFVYHREAGWNGGEAIAFSRRFIRINQMFADKADKADIKAAAEKMQPAVETFFKDYSMPLDQDVTSALLALFYKNNQANLMPSEILRIGLENNGDFSAYVAKAFEKSIFTDKARLEKWLEKPKALDKDPIYALSMNIIESYQTLYARYEEAQNLGNQGERLYMKGLMEMQSDRNFYPDANFTMRLTYGTVEPYKAADAVNYNYYTTMDGVMAKYVPGNWEFDIPQDVRDLVAKKDYGRYANENGELVVNFITTNDITGGNSGSPVIDGEGNLIGLAFDGNWEAMSGDLSFENKVQRTICMDARYLLWCIEKVGKCDNIIKELVIK